MAKAGLLGRLEITDLTNSVSLLTRGSGFMLDEWEPSYPGIKTNGIWIDSPLSDGRQLAMRHEVNAIETFSLVLRGTNVDTLVAQIRKLRRLLNQAVNYWILPVGVRPKPVYLLVQAPCESAPRYALIMDYRAPNDPNPFFQPFNALQSVAPNFQLIIERGDWYGAPSAGGVGTCIELEDYEWDDILYSSNYKPPLANTDVILVNQTTQAVTVGATHCIVGKIGGDSYDVGVRFRNITIPANSRSRNTMLQVWPDILPWPVATSIRIVGEANVTPAAFSTYADYIGRERTTKEFIFSHEAIYTGGGIQFSHNLEYILDEIFALPGWASGNDVVLFIEDYGNDEGAAVYFGGWTPPNEPELNLTAYCEDDAVYVPPTCDGTIIPISNAYTVAQQPNYVYYYDASLGTYTGNLWGTALPWQLLPNPPAVGDRFFIGTSVRRVLMFWLDGLGTDFDVDWFFSITGGGGGLPVNWSPLTLKDGTNGLTTAGPSVICFEWPGNTWYSGVLSAVPPVPVGFAGTHLWIMAEVVAIGGSPAAPSQIEVPIYEVTKNWLDLSPGVLDSDYDLLGRIDLLMRSGITTSFDEFSVDRIWVGTRKVSRGFNFKSMIWFDYSLATSWGMYWDMAKGLSTVFSGGLAPQGTYSTWHWNPAGVSAMSRLASFYLRTPYAVNEYKGTFQVFLRRYGMTTPENVQYQLGLSSTPSDPLTDYFYLTDIVVDEGTPDWAVMNFGTITIPEADNFSINILAESTGAADVYYLDLILIPMDEWFCCLEENVTAEVNPTVTEGQTHRLDSINGDISEPFLGTVNNGAYIIRQMIANNSGALLFDQEEDVRVHFFFERRTASQIGNQREARPIYTYTAKIEVLQKFFGMRF